VPDRQGNPLRVVVIDDHAAVRAGLERLLTRAEGIELVAGFADDRTLLELLDTQPVDVLVLDYDLERGDGMAVCLRVKQLDRAPAVVIYSGYAGPGITLAAMAAGADAVVSKADSVESLLTAIRQASAGVATVLPPPQGLRDAAYSRLRQDDLAVLAMLLDGVRIADIGATLGLDECAAMGRARRVVGVLQSARDAPTQHAMADV
jgi:DNA-binding NarL/FixJ family response regulator